MGPLLLVGTPLVLAVVLWFHPPGGESIFEDVREDVDAWLTVHTLFLLFIPLLAIAVYVLLRDLTGRAATVSASRSPSSCASTPQVKASRSQLFEAGVWEGPSAFPDHPMAIALRLGEPAPGLTEP